MKSKCETLDDYIDDVLSVADREAFEHHIAECEECLEATLLQGKLDDALRQYAHKIEVPPRVARSGKGRNSIHRRLLIYCASVAAALLFVLLSYQGLQWNQSNPVVSENVHPELPPASAELPPASVARSDSLASAPESGMPQFRSIESDGFMAVIEPPANDDLTVVMLYPKFPLSK